MPERAAACVEFDGSFMTAILRCHAAVRLWLDASPDILRIVRSLLATLVSLLALSGCGAVAGPEAPQACGFPDGAALSYAGRSTTSALGVQEGVGDPMSDDPADIYITRDRFDQGQLNGRLVCAIYVNPPGFVEVTVHPADDGRVGGAPEAPPEPEPLASDEVEIVTHCGLDFARVEYEGQTWKFDVRDEPNAPPGWGSNTAVIRLRPGPNGPIAIGPDGSEWQLIPAVDEEGDVCF